MRSSTLARRARFARRSRARSAHVARLCAAQDAGARDAGDETSGPAGRRLDEASRGQAPVRYRISRTPRPPSRRLLARAPKGESLVPARPRLDTRGRLDAANRLPATSALAFDPHTRAGRTTISGIFLQGQGGSRRPRPADAAPSRSTKLRGGMSNLGAVWRARPARGGKRLVRSAP